MPADWRANGDQSSLGEFDTGREAPESHCPPSHATVQSQEANAAQSTAASSSNTGSEDVPQDTLTDGTGSTTPGQDHFVPTSDSPSEIFARIADEFESAPVRELTRPSFSGCGVYGLFYHGDLEMYSEISNPPRTQNTPIYVGKAAPSGARTGGRDDIDHNVPKLAERLTDHYESIQEAQNLRTSDFTFCTVTLEVPFIRIAEQALIDRYRPWWNSYITGVGNHDVGAGRAGSEQSQWDTFHPGRHFVQKRNLVPRGTQREVRRTEIAPKLTTDDRYDTNRFRGCGEPDPYDPTDTTRQRGTGIEEFI